MWRRFGVVLAIVVAAACAAAEAPEPDPAGSLSGELQVVIRDRRDGTSVTSYLLAPGAGGVDGRLGRGGRRLLFHGDPRLPPGARIRVWGYDEGGALRVTRVERLAATGDAPAARLPLIGATALPVKKMALIPIDFGGGVGVSAADAAALLTGVMPGGGSAKQRFLSMSYGRQDIQGTVLPTLTAAQPADCESNTLAALADGLRPMVTGTYDHYLWYFGTPVPSCDFEGLAFVGTPSNPKQDSFYNELGDCRLLVHEPGHNLGLRHSSLFSCGALPLADDPSMDCTSDEYGDPYDVMGTGCDQTNGANKGYLGWMQGCNGVRVAQSGRFTLFPAESACNGIQVLEVPMPSQRAFLGPDLDPIFGVVPNVHFIESYYLELRSVAGAGPAVEVHVSGQRQPPDIFTEKTWLLDMKPSTPEIDGLAVGATFEDPAGGVRLRLESVSATKADVTVEIDAPATPGPPTCLDGTTVLPPGPATCDGMAMPVPDGGADDGGGAGGSGGGGGGAPASGTGGIAGGTGGAPAGSGGGGGRGTVGTGGRNGSGGSGTGGLRGGSGGDRGTGGTSDGGFDAAADSAADVPGDGPPVDAGSGGRGTGGAASGSGGRSSSDASADAGTDRVAGGGDGHGCGCGVTGEGNGSGAASAGAIALLLAALRLRPRRTIRLRR